MQLFFEPRSVVLIGVSRQSGPGTYNNLEMMARYGYQGRIYVVHPKVPEILGHKTYPRVADLPVTPDLAIISVGRDRVLPVFEECAQKGIRRVIVISQGFADADERGKELQRQLMEMAAKHGVRVVGPNTMGILNAFTGFSTAFVDTVRDPSPPPFSIIAQSGVFQVGYESFTGSIGKAIDVGNAGDVDFIDALEYLENDPQTRLIAIHMEGMRRGGELLKVAERIARKKPIIVLKTGRSAAGARAALSHTGSLVGEDSVFDAAFARAGIVRVRNMIELRAACRAFRHFRSLKGPRVGVVTATGACGIMTADACEDYGLELAPLPEKIREELELAHIAWHHLHNPVDLWPLGMVTGSFIEVFKRAVRGLIEDSGVDAVIGIGPALSSPLHADLDLIAAGRELNRSNPGHKPIALWLYGGDELAQERTLGPEPDLACFGSIDEAVMGLAAFLRYQKLQAEKESGESTFTPDAFPSGHSSHFPLVSPDGILVGEAAFEILKQYGIPQAPGKLAPDAESACAFAGEAGYPVVLKIISPQWLHKSDLGGIRLHITTELELRKAHGDLTELFRQQTPDGILEGILVQKEIQGTEILMGIKKDPQFGPILVVGMGGIYAEVFKDISRSLVPVTLADAERMLGSLHIFPILKGIRGQKGASLDKLAQTIVSLSRLALDYPEIGEMDLNPVLANAEGCWCVDCRILIDRGSGGSTL